MARKGQGSRSGGGGVTPHQFCCGCICFLGSVLAFQVCVLANLLRRLAEIHGATREPQSVVAAAQLALPALPVQVPAQAPAPAPAQAPAQAPAASPRLRPASQGVAVAPGVQSVGTLGSSASQAACTGGGLTLGSAIGLGANDVLLFLASLLRASGCSVVLFVDRSISQDALKAEGVDLSRVTFEQVSLPLPGPWSTCRTDNLEMQLFSSYLERTGAASRHPLLQLADAKDIAFQSDPFAWIPREPGVHVFSHESTWLVQRETHLWGALGLLYGQSAAQMAKEPQLGGGFVCGTSAEVQAFARAVAADLDGHQACQKPMASLAVLNALARGIRPRSGIGGAMRVHVHDNKAGAVWTGAKVPRQAILLNDMNELVNEAGGTYAVLQKYSEHEDIWRILSDKFLKGRRQQLARLDCSRFEVKVGDMRGADLSHEPADTVRDCCATCLGDQACAAFIYSPSRKHCWLKLQGGLRVPANRGDDVSVGVRLEGVR